MIHCEALNLAQPIKHYPGEVQELFVNEAHTLLNDLEQNHLVVKLADSTDPDKPGNKPRTVENKNPDWYSELWETYGLYYKRHTRYKTSCIRRFRVVNSLSRIINNKDMYHKSPKRLRYDYIIRALIRDRLINDLYLEKEGLNIPARLTIRGDESSIDYYTKPF